MTDTHTETIYDKLRAIQFELKAPKDQTGRFGAHRSAEGVLAAVKPLLHQHGITLTISDDIVSVGSRNYIKATATASDGTGQITATALAWEGEASRGLDASQVTGMASSYARKYALGGLFAIDDTKDADTDEHRKLTATRERPGAGGDATRSQKEEIARILTIRGFETIEAQQAKLKEMGETLPLTVGAASRVLDALKGGAS